MISVEEARMLLIHNLPTAQSTLVALREASQRILAEDIYAPMNVPSFDNAAMDGYAFAFDSYQKGLLYLGDHVIQAGETKIPVLQSGEVARIFTGAPIPEGADTVVMQEKVSVAGKAIAILEDAVQGTNIRREASQTAVHEKVIAAGNKLSPGVIGLLASLGLPKVKVYTKPRVAIIVTGNELVAPGDILRRGQIYESNASTLVAALHDLYTTPHLMEIVADDPAKIKAVIDSFLPQCDMLIITGGISVGDYDFVQDALAQAGVQKIFYKVKQKPGKPLYSGKKNSTLVFGLPGNPAAVLTCFYQYVAPCIKGMQGVGDFFEHHVRRRLTAAVHKKVGLTHFMKGRMEGEAVTVLSSQESYKLDAFVATNCLVELEEGGQFYDKGAMVAVYPI